MLSFEVVYPQIFWKNVVRMYLTEVKSKKKGKLYCSTLIRESYREDGMVKNKTIANLSDLPKDLIQNIKSFLEGDKGDCKISSLGIG